MGIKQLVILACALVVGQTALARERFQIELNDRESHGVSILHLKQLLERQHRVNADRYQLVGVRLVAKSEHGQGSASLIVGRWTSNERRIFGNLRDWHNPNPVTFDQLDFNNNALNDRGVWQMELRGNIKARRVVLILDRIGGGGGDDGGFVHFNSVLCSSVEGRLAACEVPGRIVSLRVLRQHSNAPCISGQTFGVYERGIWVRGGCRATFEVGTRN